MPEVRVTFDRELNDDARRRIRNALDQLPCPQEHVPALQAVVEASGNEMTIDVCCRDVSSAAQAAMIKAARGAGYAGEAG
jgi:hypothetical protein